MKTLTLQIDDQVSEKFMWLLQHFAANEVKIVELDESLSDDAYLRSIDGMVESLQQARQEPQQQGVSINQLDW
ncbi:MAG: hypothetical protein ACP5D0_07600 [Hydrogenovibrio sp.]